MTRTNKVISGPWPQPHTDEVHAQVGEGPDADYAQPDDTKYVPLEALYSYFIY